MADVKLNNQIVYTASSPDEKCLVHAAKYFGVTFAQRGDNDELIVEKDNELQTFKLLKVFEFDSFRRRMSIIYRDSEGAIKLICKGAEDVILDRLSEEDSTE